MDKYGKDLACLLRHGDWVVFTPYVGEAPQAHEDIILSAGAGHILEPRRLDLWRSNGSQHLTWPDDWYWGFVYVPPDGKRLNDKRLEEVCKPYINKEFDLKTYHKLPTLMFNRIIGKWPKSISGTRRGHRHRMRLPQIPLEEV